MAGFGGGVMGFGGGVMGFGGGVWRWGGGVWRDTSHVLFLLISLLLHFPMSIFD